ncbi:histidine kinase [Chitinophaga sedimenti]|uniref:sensor histidine kinase n=1 Tax=Chitinophaga sedimenti TaxID=2033606 RepID=UPI00200597A5|nr:histidine kinase [Chitinophaga sedimenti]MCK7554905.1 histidine kinase [Chitinophaga sedimenti]
MASLATFLLYNASIGDAKVTLQVVLLSLPAHLFYFYIVAYIGLPKLLFRKHYVAFGVFLVSCMLLATVLFRIIEILVVEDLINAVMVRDSPGFIWHKMDGSFWERLTRTKYFIIAMEETNIAVWLALTIKFFKMYTERRQAALQAELEFLKGQVHPHFLFNTLNNLYALTLQHSPRSPQIVLGLSEILRYMLYECNVERVSLKRDIAILQSYVALEQLRYEERLDLTFSINGDPGAHQIAPLLVLPLVENAFKHGASEDAGAPWINIDLRVHDDHFKFKIANSRPEQAPNDAAVHFGNIGLRNVRKRLEILYPGAHQLRTVAEDDTFIAILEVALNKHLQ